MDSLINFLVKIEFKTIQTLLFQRTAEHRHPHQRSCRSNNNIFARPSWMNGPPSAKNTDESKFWSWCGRTTVFSDRAIWKPFGSVGLSSVCNRQLQRGDCAAAANFEFQLSANVIWWPCARLETGATTWHLMPPLNYDLHQKQQQQKRIVREVLRQCSEIWW